ncbi:MAG TPA: GNAT family N-acetyltransferase [Thauera sp.]|uniref:bifunctional acetate--CoA ligase family protein/GNAT family N-acetyltransferase n=1 Tax=Thauera sp. TaxID=1905334 RepID=UPI002C3BA133|nr:GNAT family N-acetyltransferase [Thauera sp.]HRP24924.1 GNAT family N-acetyltransferase [Thauera sp.]HRP66360.1 GNAT family N-acetyltransferase [Thauera sp.]
MAGPHALSSAFEPSSIAVIGASDTPGSVGRLIYRNLIEGGYRGTLYAVNPKYDSIQDQPCHRSIEDIGRPVDLAIIATPARVLHNVTAQCGRSGVRNAVIVSATGRTLERRIIETARETRLRLLGPGSLGIARPGSGLIAALTRIAVKPGEIALVSQSGAMCSVVLDWAQTNNVGFSSVISLGGTVDIDFGETLEYLIHDPQTRYILLYVDHIRDARHFMSALRSAARVKPIILLKAGRHGRSDNNAPAADSAGLADRVFDAAMRRAGVVRVQNIDQLFFATKALSCGFRPRQDSLAIVSNGSGPADLAADRAKDLGTALVSLGSPTVATLERLGGRERGCHNPLDLGGDASPQLFRDAILALAEDAAVSNVLVILSPHALVEPVEVAQEIIDLAAQVRLKLCCCWMGGGQVAEARALLEQAGLPVFSSPEAAIELFHNISRFHHSQNLLLQTAGGGGAGTYRRTGGARVLVETLLNQRRHTLSAMESKALLRSFGIPVTHTTVARDATEALFIAEQVGFPVAMKVDAPELDSKSEAGGVRLNLNTAESVWTAYQDIVDAVRLRHPQAQVNGVAIEPYLYRPRAREFSVQVHRDPTFGPVISLGAQDASAPRTFALPPLNPVLARDLIDSAMPAAAQGPRSQAGLLNRGAVEQVLVSVSDLVCELPWVRELEIGPLIVDADGAVAADARVAIDHGLPAGSDRYAHMAIHPYPLHLIQDWKVGDGRAVRTRPVRPEDAELLLAFFDGLSKESRYLRFMEDLQELSPAMVARFTQIDYDREMALIATTPDDKGAEQMVGSARYALAADGESVEFALVVADGWQRFGLGRRLMGALIEVARSKGYRSIFGDVLGNNAKMLRLMHGLGFLVQPHPEESALRRVVKPLHGK